MTGNNTHSIIERVLDLYRGSMGGDADKYRNHVYRVYQYCLLLDNNNANGDKYAIAAVFHDIGLWTANTLDYLDPSIEQAQRFLAMNNFGEWREEITAMIKWHHKLSAYRNEFAQTTETFRKADWIDVSYGLITFGCNRRTIRQHRKEFPTLGFHRFLLGRIIKNLFKHPLKPLPMFRL